ncbi:ATP-binding protein [bacterium]|nr:ATP-binding protein [bacterium]
MKRIIRQQLVDWKNQKHRKPLILRGARQVGKTWSVMSFGNESFDGSVHLVDLEKHPDWHAVFEKDLDVRRIISELEFLLNSSIKPGQDLLFFDEIQSCPRALMALRYFYEDMPELHVIAAGSLLEFALKDISFPVGRVQTFTMHPLSFVEFLHAVGKPGQAELLTQPPQKLSDTVHQALLDGVRTYMFVGGMPECVQRYAESGKMRDAFTVQADLINTFRQDFLKYAPLADKQCLNAVLTSVAGRAGQQIKYARLAEGFSNPTIKKAFNLLAMARLFQKVGSVNPPVIPFGASVSETIFKTVMLDIGLMQQLCHLPVNVEFSKTDLLSIYEGGMAEQFVGQELMAAGQHPLYYWSRDSKSSTAEVDYLIAQNGLSIPVEVKSGAAGRLKSLHLFLKQYPHSPGGIVLSCAPYAELPEQKLTFLPLYYAYGLIRPL